MIRNKNEKKGETAKTKEIIKRKMLIIPTSK